MIFLTVGTQFPFDRLLRAVDRAFDTGLIGEDVFAQVGRNKYVPRNFEFVQFLEKDAYDYYLKRASSIIGHAGTGTIRMAMENNKSFLVMPRRKKYGEVVNDHQVQIARGFEQLGHILVAYDEQDLPKKIEELKCFVPKERETQVDAVVARILRFLSQIRKGACDADI